MARGEQGMVMAESARGLWVVYVLFGVEVGWVSLLSGTT